MSRFRRGHTAAAKLDGVRVLEIRRLYHEEGWSQGRLAREFGVGTGQIGRIVRNEAWQEYSQIGRTESEVLHQMAKDQGRDWDSEAKASYERLQKLVEVQPYEGPPNEVAHGVLSPGLLRLKEEVEQMRPELSNELDEFLKEDDKSEI